MTIEILDLRPEPPGGKTLARFTVNVDGGILIRSYRLDRNARGELRVRSPQIEGVAAVSFAPEIAEIITKAAADALEKADANDRSAA